MRRLLIALALSLAACQPAGDKAAVSGGAGASAWSGVAADDMLHFSGTEPFWGGQAVRGSLTWQTPDDQAGTTIAVERFAGRNGMGLSGMLDGVPFELAVSEGECSDGMSDRRYPFIVTVRRGGDTLRGCGWSDARPFAGPARS